MEKIVTYISFSRFEEKTSKRIGIGLLGLGCLLILIALFEYTSLGVQRFLVFCLISISFGIIGSICIFYKTSLSAYIKLTGDDPKKQFALFHGIFLIAVIFMILIFLILNCTLCIAIFFSCAAGLLLLVWLIFFFYNTCITKKEHSYCTGINLFGSAKEKKKEEAAFLPDDSIEASPSFTIDETAEVTDEPENDFEETKVDIE